MFSRRSFVASSSALLIDAGFSFPALAASLPDVLRAATAGAATPAFGAVVIRNGKIDEIAAVGLRRLGRPEHVQIGDAWLIGSCGKPMTTAMIARLVDRGVLSWTAPLSTMLPDLAQTMRPDYRSVTLVQLLSHRAGLPRGDELVNDRTFSDPRPLPQQRHDFLALALKEPPVAAPGTAAHYSNAGFIAAGAIAERATGVPHEELMRREVFQPLGMSSVVFSQPAEGELSGHRDGRPAKPSESGPGVYNPAGLLRLTLQDWARFCLDQLAGAKGNGRLLSPASYRLMQTSLPGSDDAMTWGFDASLGGRKGPVLSHTGTDENWYASVNLFLDSGDGILLVANAGKSMGGDTADRAALKALLPTVSTPA
jgi:CubicO group peptidase (beta-lactamase class C family)